MGWDRSDLIRRMSGCEKSAAAFFTAGLLIGAIALTPRASLADEGGVSFWLPGTFGSLAPVPGQPGWSFATIGYNTNVSAGANVAAAREFEIGALTPSLRVNLAASLHGDVGVDFPISTTCLRRRFLAANWPWPWELYTATRPLT
jgi:hypothetical protein